MKPILFNTEMVRAILEGRKTVTRRVIKPRNPIIANREGYKQGYGLWIDPSTDNGDKQGHIKDYSISPLWSTWKWYINHYAPYQVGDILYVREAWAKDCFGNYVYKADYVGTTISPEWKWKPSIHMPKEAARIFLKVTDVRVERLQDITAKDAFNEGTGKLFLEDIAYSDKDYECDLDDEYGLAREQFAWLWESTLLKNDLPRYGWDANPWVWVIEFERIEQGEQ